MPSSKYNKFYYEPNGQRKFITYDELKTAVDNWCNNVDKEKIIRKYGHITHWKFSSKIRSFEKLFYDKVSFNENLSGWNVSNITNMSQMFYGCVSFLGLGLETWNTYWLSNTFNMFRYCHSLICDLSRWNVSNLNFAKCMFNGCSNFNSDLSRWQFKHLEHTNFMFYDCENFNSDLSGWDVSKVKVMNDMFVGCKNLTSDFSSWNISNVFDMRNMFDGCNKTNLYSALPWIKINKSALEQLFYGMNNTFSALYLLYSAQMYDNMTYLYLTLEIQDIMEYMRPFKTKYSW